MITIQLALGLIWGLATMWAYYSIKPLFMFIGQRINPAMAFVVCLIPITPALVFLGKKYYQHKLKHHAKGDIEAEFAQIVNNAMRKI